MIELMQGGRLMVLVTSRESDLSRRPGALPFRFSVEGTDYWIDLTPDEIDAFEDAVNPFVAAARTSDPDTPPRRRRAAGAPLREPSKSSLVRAWARARGLPVNTRGKVPATLEAAYDSAYMDGMSPMRDAPGADGPDASSQPSSST